MPKNKRIKLDLDVANVASTSTSDGSAGTQLRVSQMLFNKNKTNFKEAVKWSGFVDKSLLIQELLDENKANQVVVFAPKRFGKSMNLDMVKCFLEIQKGRSDIVNLEDLETFENYRAFRRIGPNGKENFGKQCKILDHTDVVEKHFGRYPIVHLDLKEIQARTLDDAMKLLKLKVSDAYQAHEYLRISNKLSKITEMNKDYQEYCKKWMTYDSSDEKIKDTELRRGFQNLIKHLHAHHESKVFLLVDEFDAPTVDALLARVTGEEVVDIGKLVTGLLGSVLKGEICDNYLQGALITGVSYLGSCGISGILNNTDTCKFLQDGRFINYYGLTEIELTLVLEKVIPEEERKVVRGEIDKLYNGYCYKGNPMYCLWSVLHYLRNYFESCTDRLDFWDGADLAKNLVAILKHDPIMKDMLHLMGGGHKQFEPVKTVNVKQLADFFQLESQKESKDSEPDPSTVFTFLLEQGYVCCDPDITPSVENEIVVKIPNDEIKSSLMSMFKTYCIKIGGRIDVLPLMDKCVSSVKRIPVDCDKSDPQKFLTRLYESWRELFEIFKEPAAVKEVAIQAVLYCAMFRGNFKQCDPEKFLKGVEDSSGRIDLWIQREDGFGIICELKYNAGERDGNRGAADKTADRAYDEIINVVPPKKVSYASILDEQKIKHYLLIGLSMSGDLRLSLKCSINSRDKKDSISFPTIPSKLQGSISSLPLDQTMMSHSSNE